jgi:4-methyl-5(b-hydroxyethyl)-thiazole monophosphate biosynthesis
LASTRKGAAPAASTGLRPQPSPRLRRAGKPDYLLGESGGHVHDGPMSKRALCLVVDGLEEIETITPVDLLRRAGAEVTTAALGDSRQVCGRCGVMIEADALLDGLDPSEFDVLVIPGGPGVSVMRADGRPAQLAAEFVRSGEGGGGDLCGAAGAQGCRGAGGQEVHRSFQHLGRTAGGASGGGGGGRRPVITSRGAGTAMAFSLVLIEVLFGSERAREIGASIML